MPVRWSLKAQNGVGRRQLPSRLQRVRFILMNAGEVGGERGISSDEEQSFLQETKMWSIDLAVKLVLER